MCCGRNLKRTCRAKSAGKSRLTIYKLVVEFSGLRSARLSETIRLGVVTHVEYQDASQATVFDEPHFYLISFEGVYDLSVIPFLVCFFWLSLTRSILQEIIRALVASAFHIMRVLHVSVIRGHVPKGF